MRGCLSVSTLWLRKLSRERAGQALYIFSLYLCMYMYVSLAIQGRREEKTEKMEEGEERGAGERMDSPVFVLLGPHNIYLIEGHQAFLYPFMRG